MLTVTASSWNAAQLKDPKARVHLVLAKSCFLNYDERTYTSYITSTNHVLFGGMLS